MADAATILVVDDDAQIRAVAARILRRRGYTVLEAADAQSALHAMRTETIDVVVSDVFLGGMDGPTMTAAMRVLRPRLRVIFMSGAARAATNAGDETRFIAKPFTSLSLGDAVELELASVPRAMTPVSA